MTERRCKRKSSKRCASGQRIQKNSGCETRGKCVPVHKHRPYKRSDKKTYKRAYKPRVKR